MAFKILIVDDEPKSVWALQQGLAGQGYTVNAVRSGDEALSLIDTEPFDLILLDLFLPGRDEMEIVNAVRRREITTRVIVLTASGALASRVTALDGGADDCVVKPFAFEELLARIGAILRRARKTRLSVADLEINLVSRSVTRNGACIELTELEFKMLECLIRRQGQVVLRDTLANNLWPGSEKTSYLDHVIDVHIGRLRKKIEIHGTSKLIQTIRGVGFVLGAEGV